MEIIPNLNGDDQEKVSLVRFAGDATCWFYDAEYVFGRVNDLRRRMLGEMEEPSKIDTLLTSRRNLLLDMEQCRVALLRDNIKERVADATITLGRSMALIFLGIRDKEIFELVVGFEELYFLYIHSPSNPPLYVLSLLAHSNILFKEASPSSLLTARIHLKSLSVVLSFNIDGSFKNSSIVTPVKYSIFFTVIGFNNVFSSLVTHLRFSGRLFLRFVSM